MKHGLPVTKAATSPSNLSMWILCEGGSGKDKLFPSYTLENFQNFSAYKITEKCTKTVLLKPKNLQLVSSQGFAIKSLQISKVAGRRERRCAEVGKVCQYNTFWNDLYKNTTRFPAKREFLTRPRLACNDNGFRKRDLKHNDSSLCKT